MKVPVLFIVFNRLDSAKEVFAQIKVYQPEKLYIASDGARIESLNEDVKVNTVRDYLLQEIDWKCELKTLFQKENLGCKYAPQTAISWFFKNEEFGIVLEDDCLPSNSFFAFCEELLVKYESDFRVFGISGSNFHSFENIIESYYFSSYFFTWGWASWRSRWEKHLEIQNSFYQYIGESDKIDFIKNNRATGSLIEHAIASYENTLDAWDYLWILSCVICNGHIATPRKNLIKNIGFGTDATHTKGNSRNQKELEKINFPLKHPMVVQPNTKMDNLLFKNVLQWKSPFDKMTNFGYMKAYTKVLHQRVKMLLNIL